MSSDSHSLFNNILINKAIEEFIERRLFSLLNVKYTYAVMSKKNPSELLTISNYPKKWEIIYKENNYQYIDPIVNIALNSILPFSWNEKIIINSKLKLSIFEVAKKHEVINGYTFVTHDCANNLVTLSVLIDKNNELQIFSKIEKNKEKIQMLLMLIHHKLISLYQDKNLISNLIVNYRKDIFSRRENDVLYWASMGRTYKEIASLLGITTSTVKFHIANVVKKLGVANAKQAICLSSELNLQQPVLTNI